MAYQTVQIMLASFTVVAYAALQPGRTKPSDRTYLLANLVGAAGLLVVALRSVELGFVITNGLWVLVSAAGLWNGWRNNRAESTPGAGARRRPRGRPPGRDRVLIRQIERSRGI